VLEISGLRFRYPAAAVDALNGIDLVIEAGSFTTIAGPSGGGKSTLLRSMNGLVPHLSGGAFGGSVLVDGLDTRQYGPRVLSRSVGFVFQDPDAQGVASTVEEDIAFSLEQMGVAGPIMRKRVEEMLDLFGLAGLRKREIATLSGGERQRVALAGALALQPKALVLDEPTSQLDPWGADDLVHAATMLNDEIGTAIVIAEHRLDRLVRQTRQFVWIGDGCASQFPDIAGAAGLIPEVCLPMLVRVAEQMRVRPAPSTVREVRAALGDVLLPHPAESDRLSAGDELVSVKGLCVRREGAQVLSGVDFTARAGEIVALMGRNGSGKTTLIRTMFGFLRPHKGSVRVCEMDMTTAAPGELGKVAAYLPQQHKAVLINRSLRDEIGFTMRNRPGAVWPEQMVDAFGLGGLLDLDTRDLSEGQRLRAALVAVLTGAPQVVFLDEPTRGLDGIQRAAMADVLRTLRATGTCVVLATHDVELIAMLADRVVLLGGGEVVAEGTPRDVLSGSLAYSTVVNRIFGNGYLTLDDLPGREANLEAGGDTITVRMQHVDV
jgi:energy-coupling factor transport system ATP-binding protein